MTRKHEVDNMNRKQLNELKEQSVVLVAKDTGDAYALQQLQVSQSTHKMGHKNTNRMTIVRISISYCPMCSLLVLFVIVWNSKSMRKSSYSKI